MKRIIMIMVAAFLMGGMVMAQHARRGDKMPEPKVRAERMTERMAKEYSLNDTQKKQLLEANLVLVEKMGDMPKHRRGDIRKGKKDCACTCSKADKHHNKKDSVAKKECGKAQLTDEQRAQKKAEMAKKREEMTAARTAYNAQLQKIMTKEQYASYTKNLQERKAKMESKRKDHKQV